MSEAEQSPPAYPTLTWLVRNGRWLPSFAALAVTLGGGIAAYVFQSIAAAVLAGAIAGVAYFGVRVLVEMITLITDMLMPR